MGARDAMFGLTGGIAAGKSTVAGFFAELGAQVIDADRLGHELIRKPLPAYQEIVTRFGKTFLASDGEIDRRRLGALVFDDPQMLRELNSILHPQIILRVNELAEQCRAQDPRAVILVDAALIYEAGIAERFTKVIVVWCRPEQQIERLMEKAGISRPEAERRIATQMPAAEKRRRADYLINCSGKKEDARKQVEVTFAELKKLVAE